MIWKRKLAKKKNLKKCQKMLFKLKYYLNVFIKFYEINKYLWIFND